MRKDLTNLRRVGVLVLLAAVLTIGGCSDNSILGPDLDETAGLGNAKTIGAVLPDVAAVVEVTMTIDDQTGGVIPINHGNSHHAFIVEPRGLDSDKVISVKAKKEKINSKKDAVSFEFGPDGLVFNEASKLEFEIAEINAKALSAKLYYFDPRIQDWVLQAEGPVVQGIVTFEIYHFSKYAISD